MYCTNQLFNIKFEFQTILIFYYTTQPQITNVILDVGDMVLINP